jgi:hypothetical protein
MNVAEIMCRTDWMELAILNFDKNRNENSRNFEYQTRRHLPQVSIEYLHALLR